MKFAITMRTNDRSPGPNYLRETLDNARRAGILDDGRVVSFDIVPSHTETPALRSEVFPYRGEVEVHSRVCRITPNGAATEAHVVADRHDADYVLFFEDDLDFCDDFIGSTERWLREHDDGICPMFVLGHVWPINHRRSRRLSARRFYGSQCYAVPSRTHGELVRWLIDNPKYKRGNQLLDRCHDLRLAVWVQERGCKELIAASPSFVNHIGKVSGMGCPPVKFASWPGREWSYKRTKEAVA